MNFMEKNEAYERSMMDGLDEYEQIVNKAEIKEGGWIDVDAALELAEKCRAKDREIEVLLDACEAAKRLTMGPSKEEQDHIMVKILTAIARVKVYLKD